MTECCATCEFHHKLQKWDYSNRDTNWKTEEPGFVCSVFPEEMIHMVGTNEYGDYPGCEMYTPKEMGVPKWVT